MNKKSQSFSIQKRIKSFYHAFNGLKILFIEEHNARIHFVAALIVIFGGFAIGLSHWDWIAILICIALVFITEVLNSAIENICDFISPEKHESIKKIKDLSAAAVLLASFFAAIIGILILSRNF